MADAVVTRWNLVNEFTAREAACLAIGIDPGDPEGAVRKADPVVRRMRQDYGMQLGFATLVLVQDDRSTSQQLPQRQPRPPLEGLVGRRLRSMWLSPLDVRGITARESILQLADRFDNEMFSRSEIRDYFESIGLESEYAFDPSRLDPASLRDDDGDGDGGGEPVVDERVVELRDDVEITAFVDRGSDGLDAAREESTSTSEYPELKQMRLRVTGYRGLMKAARRPMIKAARVRPPNERVFVQKMRLQEERIIEILRSLGLEPTALAPTMRGRSDKMRVRDLALADSSLFLSATVFEQAWQRLRKDGRIAGGRPRNRR